MKLYKCYGECNGKYTLEEMVVYSGKRHCKSCFEVKEKEQNERSQLYSLIKELYKITYPTGMMLKQIKNYREQFNYTYEGMIKTLMYLEKQNLEFKPVYGLGIITYKYDEAQDYYKRQEKLLAEQMFKNEVNNEPKVITVKTRKPNNINKIKQERMINLEDLI